MAENDVKYPEMAAELMRMFGEQLDLLGSYMNGHRQLTMYEALTQPRMHDLLHTHGPQFEAVIDKIGWPQPDTVGTAATGAANFLVGHLHCFPDIEEKAFQAMVDVMDTAEIPLATFVQLEDTVLLNRGQGQIYGSVIIRDPVDGRFKPQEPIAHPEELDKRRSEIGLPPIAEQLAKANREASGSKRHHARPKKLRHGKRGRGRR